MTIPPSVRTRVFLLAAGLAFPAARALRAESGASYKYQDYRETGGRIAVQTQAALLEQDFGTETRLKVEGILDAIAGATPSGQPAPAGSDEVPLARLQERRKAWNAALARQFARVNLALGLANSRESDYVSDGGSLNTLIEFNQKNTTLLAGVAATRDDVKVFHQAPWAKKRTSDVILGLTQLLDPRTALTLNLTWSRQTGYLSDPYKIVEKRTELLPGVFVPLTFPENRPAERTKRIALLGLNRAFPEVRGAVDATYRLFHDSFGTTAHTIDLAWFQRCGARFLLRPGFRFHTQGAADFYHYRLDDTALVPTAGAPRPGGPFYSSDYRLSALRTFTGGLKLVWQPTAAWQLDAAFERYEMRGTDGITPQSPYSRANIVTAGIKFAW